MKKYIIEEDLATAIIQYIASKPYVEVSNLIALLQQLKEFIEVPEKKE